jgi:hypothetical protein
MKSDKFHYLGKYVHVFGNIIRRSIPLFIIVLINLISFVLAFRNRANYNFNSNNNNQTDDESNHQMVYFNGTFSNSLFKSFEFLVGVITTEDMGMYELNSRSFINFLIYGCFIFIMTILFINIFTGISIDEIQYLIQHSDAEIQSRKIEYCFKIEILTDRYFKKIYQKFKIIQKKVFYFFSKLFDRYKCLKFILMSFRKVSDISKILIDFIKKIIEFILDKLRHLFKCIKEYSKDCWQKKKNGQIQKEDSNNNSNQEFEDRMKNLINELKMIMQSKFESIDRNMKKENLNLEKQFKKINERMEKIENRLT